MVSDYERYKNTERVGMCSECGYEGLVVYLGKEVVNGNEEEDYTVCEHCMDKNERGM